MKLLDGVRFPRRRKKRAPSKGRRKEPSMDSSASAADQDAAPERRATAPVTPDCDARPKLSALVQPPPPPPPPPRGRTSPADAMPRSRSPSPEVQAWVRCLQQEEEQRSRSRDATSSSARSRTPEPDVEIWIQCQKRRDEEAFEEASVLTFDDDWSRDPVGWRADKVGPARGGVAREAAIQEGGEEDASASCGEKLPDNMCESAGVSQVASDGTLPEMCDSAVASQDASDWTLPEVCESAGASQVASDGSEKQAVDLHKEGENDEPASSEGTMNDMHSLGQINCV